MGRTLRRNPESKGIKTRNYEAVAAHQRNSGGPMGGTVRAQVRRDRQNEKRALKAGQWS